MLKSFTMKKLQILLTSLILSSGISVNAETNSSAGISHLQASTEVKIAVPGKIPPTTPAPKPTDAVVRMKSDGWWWQKDLCLTSTSDGLQKLQGSGCGTHVYNQYNMVSANDGKWCMAVSDAIKNDAADWDYVVYVPCQIGNPQQLWTTYYDPNQRARLFKPINYPDYKFYVNQKGFTFLSKKSNEYYAAVFDYTDSGTRYFLNSAPAAKMMTLSADFWWDHRKFSYPIFPNGGTYSEETNFIIDKSGKCFRSNLNSDTSGWAYITYETCPDNPETASSQFKWQINASQDGFKRDYVTIFDYNGNKVINSIFGHGWGVPYVGGSDYIMNNKNNSWYNDNYSLRAVVADGYRNLAQNEFKAGGTCGAKQDNYYPAAKSKGLTHAPGQPGQYNPPTLTSDQWNSLLYRIATSSAGSLQRLTSFCGVCVLHSFEMMDQIMTAAHFGLDRPPSEAGLLFDIGNTNPMANFANRHERRAQQLLSYMTSVNIYLGSARTSFTQEQMQAYHSNVQQYLTANMLPQYSVTLNAYPANNLNNMVSDVNSSVVGSGFIAFINFSVNGQGFGHAVPVYHSANGPIMITTNTSTQQSIESFRRETGVVFNGGDGFLARFRTSIGEPAATINFVNLIRVNERPNPLMFSQSVSFGNCDQGGPGNRGNGKSGVASTLNVCGVSSGGRCSIQ